MTSILVLLCLVVLPSLFASFVPAIPSLICCGLIFTFNSHFDFGLIVFLDL